MPLAPDGPVPRPSPARPAGPAICLHPWGAGPCRSLGMSPFSTLASQGKTPHRAGPLGATGRRILVGQKLTDRRAGWPGSLWCGTQLALRTGCAGTQGARRAVNHAGLTYRQRPSLCPRKEAAPWSYRELALNMAGSTSGGRGATSCRRLWGHHGRRGKALGAVSPRSKPQTPEGEDHGFRTFHLLSTPGRGKERDGPSWEILWSP